MIAKLVQVRSEYGSKPNVFVIHLTGRLLEPSDPTYVGPIYQAYMLLLQEDGDSGPAVMSLFGDHQFFPQIRKAWRAFVKDDSVTTSQRYGKIHPVDEWSLKWLTKAFVRYVGRAATDAASGTGASTNARARSRRRTTGHLSRAPTRPDRDRLEIPPGGGIRFASPTVQKCPKCPHAKHKGFCKGEALGEKSCNCLISSKG